MYAGARLADCLLDLLDVGSAPARLGAKVLLVVAALPAGFYLVERLFLRTSSRRAAGPDADGP